MAFAGGKAGGSNFYPPLRISSAQSAASAPQALPAAVDDASVVSGHTTRSAPWSEDWDRPKPSPGSGASYYPPLKLTSLRADLAESHCQAGRAPPTAPHSHLSFQQKEDISSSALRNELHAFSGLKIPSTFAPPEALAAQSRLGVESNAIETSTTATAQSSGFDTAGCCETQPWNSPVQAGAADCDGTFMESPREALPLATPAMSSQWRHGMAAPGTCAGLTAQSGSAANAEDAPEVEVRGSQSAPKPWTSWAEVRFPSRLLSPLVEAGFKAPSLIQQYAWPIAVQGTDLIGIAKTGSGKTLAFLLPAFARLIESNADPRAPPAILVLAPTRELAVQIEAQAKSFGGPAGMRAACLYGGAPKGPQLGQLRMRPQALIATPGRLNDLLDPPPGLTLAVDMKGVKFLVLDEADRMLDMGFEPQIRKIICSLPKERQTMMFTATWPAAVRRLGGEFLRDPLELRIGDADVLTVNPDIEQHVQFCTDVLDKDRRLEEILREAGEDQTIVFVSTKRMCDMVAFRTPGSVAIHGDKDQPERDAALMAFKSGARRVLVATDVAARGLDIKAVRLVINYDPPPREEDYVHRVGRTGRAGLKGKAVTLLTNEDAAAARSIAEVFKKGGLPVPQELANRLASGELRSGRDPSRPRARPSPSMPTGTSMRRGPAFGADDFDFDGFGRGRGFDSRNDFLTTCQNDCPTW
mmetsp:Transcript_11012/g.25161  ORF Transcript_11012/g.25161 Transcript_11012/m.25161 type:complete len:697 (-) Transcript_11012:83-2173(-)